MKDAKTCVGVKKRSAMSYIANEQKGTQIGYQHWWSTDKVCVAEIEWFKNNVHLERLSKAKSATVADLISVEAKNFQWRVRLQTPLITISQSRLLAETYQAFSERKPPPMLTIPWNFWNSVVSHDGDGAGNTNEENSSVFSLIQMH